MTQKTLLATWAQLTATVLQTTGPLSIRIAAADDPFIDALRLSDDELVDLTPGQEGDMRALLQSIEAAGLFYDSDALLLSAGAIISSRTEFCLAYDQQVHRRLGQDGVLIGCDHIFALQVACYAPPSAPTHCSTYISDDPIGVVLHDPSASQSLEMTYLGSFDMDESTLPCPALEQQEEESNLSFICDMHGARNGLRSTTIRRCAMTAEGPTRSVIFNDIYRIAA